MQSHFASPSVEVDTEILERCAIGIQWASIRPKNTDLLRREIQHLPELHFLLPDLFLGLLALGDIDHSAHHFTQVAASVEDELLCLMRSEPVCSPRIEYVKSR